VITIRLLLFRVFIKQIQYQRKMMVIQPRIKALQQKYKNDRAALQQEMLKLQQEEGFNPLAGCLPLALQMPIFIALYHTLRHLANSAVHCGPDGLPSQPVSGFLSLYSFTPQETCQAAQAKLFGGAPLASRLFEPAADLTRLGGHHGTVAAVMIPLVIISATATFLTQVYSRRANPVKPEGQAATIANLMLYLIPIGTLGSGLFFPLGVLLYWFTSNTWTLAQQLYANKYHPHEETKAPQDLGRAKALAPKVGQKPARDNRGKAAGAVPGGSVEPQDTDALQPAPDAPVASAPPRPGQRPNRGGGPRPAGRKTQAKKRR
jgi:YidC/Oxa1 family membrane protein insertase